MCIYCVAKVEDERQGENLKECIKIIGGKPIEMNGCIEVEFVGNVEVCQTFIELFEQFANHGIYSESSK